MPAFTATISERPQMDARYSHYVDGPGSTSGPPWHPRGRRLAEHVPRVQMRAEPCTAVGVRAPSWDANAPALSRRGEPVFCGVPIGNASQLRALHFKLK